MRIAYMSDLHLEFRDYRYFQEVSGGDILILAGDIITAHTIAPHRTDAEARAFANYAEIFKEQVLDKYQRVFYVMGNHEHYRSRFRETKGALEEGFRHYGLDKIEIFDNDFKIVDDVLFIGCTLWSDFEKGSPVSLWNCGLGMNDFRMIYNTGPSFPITTEFALNEHQKSVDYIRQILKLNEGKKTVVFTHHAPTLTSLNKEHVGNGLDGAYASDLSDLICGFPQIQYWIHGHTYMNVKYSVGDYCTVLAHQCGYRGERSWKQFVGPMHQDIK